MTKAPSAPQTKRARLNRARVILSAVELADQDGYEALSMRSLSDRLGVVPMALYKHVADKDDLLDGMLDLVVGEIDFPSGVGWRESMRKRALSARGVLQRHPWAVGRFETGTPGAANLAYHNATLGCLRSDAGLDLGTAVHAYSVLESYIHGFALQERAKAPQDVPVESERRRAAAIQRNPDFALEHPYLMELADQLRTGYDADREFERGLELILDGLERLVEQ